MSTVSTAHRTFQSDQLYTACKSLRSCVAKLPFSHLTFFKQQGLAGLQDKSLPSVTLIANSVTTTPLASDVANRNSKGHDRIIEAADVCTRMPTSDTRLGQLNLSGTARQITCKFCGHFSTLHLAHYILRIQKLLLHNSMCFEFHVCCPYVVLKNLCFSGIVKLNTYSMLLASTCDSRKYMSYRYCISQHMFNVACSHV